MNAIIGASFQGAPDSEDIEETSGEDGTNTGKDGGDACDVTGASGDSETCSDVETQDDDAFGDKRGDVTGYMGSTDIYTGNVDIGIGRGTFVSVSVQTEVNMGEYNMYLFNGNFGTEYEHKPNADEVARALAAARFLGPLGGVDPHSIGTRGECIDGMGVDGRCDGVDGAGFSGSLGLGGAHEFLVKSGNFEDGAGGYMDKDGGRSHMSPRGELAGCPCGQARAPPPSPRATVGGSWLVAQASTGAAATATPSRRALIVWGAMSRSTGDAWWSGDGSSTSLWGSGPQPLRTCRRARTSSSGSTTRYESVQLQPAVDDAEFDDALLALHLSVAAQGTCRGTCDNPVPMVTERRHRDPWRRSTWAPASRLVMRLCNRSQIWREPL